MKCRGCGGSNYSRVKKNKFEASLNILFPIRAYVCNICGGRFHNYGYYISLLFNATLAFVTINLIYSFSLPNNNLDVVSDTNFANKLSITKDIGQNLKNSFADFNSGHSEQVQEQILKESEPKSELNSQSLLAKSIKEKSTTNQLQVNKQTQTLSLASIDYINKLNVNDSTKQLSIKQCFRDKKIILFDQDMFVHYDNDEQEDRISLEKGQVLVYLSVPNTGITETAHYVYSIPDEYSGLSHNFVFLDRDEDGSIDNEIHAYPKNSNFPTNLCKSTPDNLVNKCSILTQEYPFEVEFSKQLKAGINWLHSQPNHNYTIQLYAGLNLLEANNFIQQHGLEHQAKVFPAIVNGQSYFKVIVGNYDQIEVAQRRISTSPRKNHAFQPLVRKFSTYYAEISKLASRISCT